jgi:hypothetical protein
MFGLSQAYVNPLGHCPQMKTKKFKITSNDLVNRFTYCKNNKKLIFLSYFLTKNKFGVVFDRTNQKKLTTKKSFFFNFFLNSHFYIFYLPSNSEKFILYTST